MDGLVLAGNTTTKSTNFGWARYGCLSNAKLDRLGELVRYGESFLGVALEYHQR